LGVGLLLLALFCIQCAHPTDAERPSNLVSVAAAEPDGSAAGSELKQLEALAKTDHIALLKKAIANYDRNYHDYTCTFIKQERINGTLLDEQTIEVKFMQTPFSVAMKWVKNAPMGERTLYVEGKHDNQMLVQPKGMYAVFTGGTVTRDPRGEDVMKNTLRPITMYGFRRTLESLLEVYELAAKRGENVDSYLGVRNVAGRKALVLQRDLPARKDYPAKQTTWYLDTEYLVVTRLEGTDWDDQLQCTYTSKDITFNVGLKDSDFTPEANGMKLKK
jgi:hypothetical protein